MRKVLLVAIVLIILIFYSFLINNYSEHFSESFRKENWDNLMFTEKLKIYRTNIGKNESVYADKLK